MDSLPIPVRRALTKLGSDISDARRRRRISTAIMAERASISRATLNKLEKGDAGVSMGTYATVLFVLGMVQRLAMFADLTNDPVGIAIDEENLPKRIRQRKR
jgi:transcriptional regulator with XRE-family HTH domain